MRKIILSLIILTSLALVFSSCKLLYQFIDPEKLGHTEHSYYYDDIEIKEAGCFTDGEKKLTCYECGKVTIEIIPAHGGHASSEWIIDAVESETSDGISHTMCTRCGVVLDTEVTHRFSEAVQIKSPGLAENGLAISICERCGYDEEHETEPLLNFTLINGEYTVSMRDGVELPVFYELVIPSTYKGIPITKIDMKGFPYLDIKSLVIPEGIKEIGSKAFMSGQFESVTLPSSLVTVWDEAFNCCQNLSNVYISDMDAWLNIDFVIGSSFAVPNPIPNYYSNPLYYANNLYLNEKLVTDVVIPEGVIEIAPYALSCNSLESVTISDSVTYISPYAFYGCDHLMRVTLGKNINTIGEYAFSGCKGVQAITLPSTLKLIDYGAFFECYSLATVVNYSSLRITYGSDEHGCVGLYAKQVENKNA